MITTIDFSGKNMNVYTEAMLTSLFSKEVAKGRGYRFTTKNDKQNRHDIYI